MSLKLTLHSLLHLHNSSNSLLHNHNLSLKYCLSNIWTLLKIDRAIWRSLIFYSKILLIIPIGWNSLYNSGIYYFSGLFSNCKNCFFSHSSCGPSWNTPDAFGYNLFLFSIGFFFPLCIIILCGKKCFAAVKRVY